MKTTYTSAIVLAVSAMAAGQAFANPDPYGQVMARDTSPVISAPAKTRAQVNAELADAQRTGNIVAYIGGDKSGTKLNQVFPTQYAAQAAAPGKTRDEVRAELAEAQRTGDIVITASSDVKQNQLFEQAVSTD